MSGRIMSHLCLFRKYSTHVPQIFQTCTTNIPDMYRKYSRHVPQIFQTCTTNISDMYHKYSRHVPQTFQTYSNMSTIVLVVIFHGSCRANEMPRSRRVRPVRAGRICRRLLGRPAGIVHIRTIGPGKGALAGLVGATDSVHK